MAYYILGQTQNQSRVLQNREKFLSENGIVTDNVICMWVQHGNDVKVADNKDAGISIRDINYSVKCDALITDEKDLYLFLLVADCSPVIIYDPIRNVLGLVHVGWTGADLNIVNKVVKKLSEIYNSDPKNLIAGIGPTARKNSFIKENPGQKDDPKWQSFLEKVDDNNYKINFLGLCKKQLIDVGVKKNNIFDCGIDTVIDERFYSHVREGKLPLEKQGRFATVVGLK